MSEALRSKNLAAKFFDQTCPKFFAPGYWMNETSGVLRPAVEAYLNNEPMSEEEIAAMRAYLRQWIAGFHGDDAADLAARVDKLTSRKPITDWLNDALAVGIDPL
jgi:hypothetical protein